MYVHTYVWFSLEDLRSCVSWLLELLGSVVNIRHRAAAPEFPKIFLVRDSVCKTMPGEPNANSCCLAPVQTPEALST